MNLYVILSSIFAGLLVLSSILAAKICSFWGLFVPAGIITYSLTYAVTDTIGELYGKKDAQNTVIAGFIVMIFAFPFIYIALHLPEAPFWKNGEAYATILGTSTRIIIASFVAYLVCQFNDVLMFHWMRTKDKGKKLWKRNLFSTVTSQVLDSVIFVMIAFYGVPKVGEHLIEMIVAQTIVKWGIAIIDTPIVYLMVYFFKNKVSFEFTLGNYEQLRNRINRKGAEIPVK